MQRIFMLEDDHAAGLQRLGVGTLLQWANIPPAVQEAIVQQALALDWTSEPEVAERAIRSLLSRSRDDDTTPDPPAP